MKRYNCIFPGLYNYILAKDVGMIPYTLSKEYEATITTYDNDEYTYLDTILNSDNLNLDFLEDSGDEIKDVKKYLKDNASSIDILQLYHLRYKQLPHYIFTYKRYNRKGKIYLKLDANNDYIDFLVKRKGLLPSLRRLYVKVLFKFIDLVSIETTLNYNKLKNSNIISENKLIYLPNGIVKSNVNIKNKEKIILYVGEIEKSNKSIDMLINAFLNIQLDEWKLVLIGNVNLDMKEFIDDKYPEFKNKIVLKGYVSDKKVLNEYYAKSSIYCCSSKKESFGISTLEAAYHGNYIISTNVGGSYDLIKLTEFGSIINHSLEDLEEKLKYTTDNWNKLKKDPENIQKIVYNEYNWDKLSKNIINNLF